VSEQTDRAARTASIRTWRPSRALLLDGILAAVVLVLMAGPQTGLAHGWGAPLGPPAYALMVVSAVALLGRRRWPRTVLAVTLAAAVAYLAAGYPVGPVFLALAVAMYSLAERSPLRETLPAAGVALVLLPAGHVPELFRVGFEGSPTAPTPTDLILWPAAWIGLSAAIGTIIRLNRDVRQRTREEEARQIAYDERLRVAREVHDVVGHGLAVINMQAGIALHVIEKRPEQAQAALDAIKTASGDALEELRSTLAVFREPEGAPRRPVSGLDELKALVKEMSASGLEVDLEVSGERPAVPGPVSLAAYRIVQESLTNVLRHAGSATATVRVAYATDAVTLEILDDGRGATWLPAQDTTGERSS
jgi:signal transduction histidine kinase